MRRAVALATSAILLGGVLTAVSFSTPAANQDTADAALSGSSFDPGNIISNSVMFDFGAMSQAKIQSFLDSKVTTCSASASAACLKSYTADTRDVAAVANRCVGNITGKKSQSAAAIIYTVAQACRVNPKVLLVTLQKEQGLVTSTSPTASKYKIAMGYGCPDTSVCDSKYYGFFNQVYQAAYAYNKYTKSPTQYTAYQPGKRSIKYNPKASCGTKSVTIANSATSALYFYTPYVPNAAALGNLGGVGDSCSSYGNRNFWTYFNTWFGSPITGGFLIKSSTSVVYVLVNGAKWSIPSTRPDILASLAPLGKPGTVSAAYLASLPTGGTFTSAVKGPSGTCYLLDGKLKYTFTSCAQATDFGFTAGPTLSADMLNLFPLQGAMTSYVKTSDGVGYVLKGGTRHNVLNAASASAAGVTLTTWPVIASKAVIGPIPVGAPYVSSATAGGVITVNGTTDKYYVTPSASYKLSPTLMSGTGLPDWLGASLGAVDPQSLGALPPAATFTGMFYDASAKTSWVLTTTGKAQLTNPAAWSKHIATADPVLIARIPLTAGRYGTQVFAVNATTRAVAFIAANGQRRTVPTPADRIAVAKSLGISSNASTFPADVLAQLVGGAQVLAPATVVRSSTASSSYWFIDGLAVKHPISTSRALEVLGTAKLRSVSTTVLNGYATNTSTVKLGFTFGGKYYVSDAGVLRPISAADKTRFGSKFGFSTYSAETFRVLPRGTAMGHLIRYKTTYYEVRSGKKYPISTATYKSLAASTGTAAQTVSTYFASQLPTGK